MILTPSASTDIDSMPRSLAKSNSTPLRRSLDTLLGWRYAECKRLADENMIYSNKDTIICDSLSKSQPIENEALVHILELVGCNQKTVENIFQVIQQNNESKNQIITEALNEYYTSAKKLCDVVSEVSEEKKQVKVLKKPFLMRYFCCMSKNVN